MQPFTPLVNASIFLKCRIKQYILLKVVILGLIQAKLVFITLNFIIIVRYFTFLY